MTDIFISYAHEDTDRIDQIAEMFPKLGFLIYHNPVNHKVRTLTRFYQFISKYLGEAAYEIRGFHGGVHPSAILEPHQCANTSYRHYWSSFYFHMGNSRRGKDFPYLMHVSAEMRGGDLKIGDNYVYKNGRITTADHPKVKAIAEKYKNRPGLEPESWLQTPR